MLHFTASVVFPISYSSHCWLPAPQRWEEDLMLSLHPASPIATTANQQGGNNYHGAREEAPPSDSCIYWVLLISASSAAGHCNRQPHLLNSDICIPGLHLLSNKQTTHQLGSWNGRAIPDVNLWFKRVWELYRQPAIIKRSIVSCLTDSWSVLQTFQKGPTASSSQHHAEEKSTQYLCGGKKVS